MARRTKNIALAAVCLALLAALAAAILYNAFPTPYREQVESCAAEYGVDTNLIYAVIKAESNFDPAAVSHAGAKGLAQLTDDTARYVAGMIGIEYSEGDSFDADINIRLSTYYLKYLLNKYDDDMACTVAAYNAGEGNVDRWLKSENGMSAIPFGETDRYLKKVRIYRIIYSVLYNFK